MKTHPFLILLSLLVACFKVEAFNDTIMVSSGDTILVICLNTNILNDTNQLQSLCFCDSTTRVDVSISQSDDVSKMTLAVNAANNALTAEAIIVGILTLFIAFLSLFEYKRFKNKVDGIKKDADELKKKNKTIENTQALNNQYLQKVNQWMLNNAYSIANTNGGKSVQSQNLMEESMLYYYLMKLLLSKDYHEIDGCINYIKTKGTLNEIEHLQFIVDNDPDKYKRDKSSEAIGYIRGRFS